MKKNDILSNITSFRSTFVAFALLFGLLSCVSVTTYAQTTINKSVIASSDDAEEAGPDATGSYTLGTMDLTSSDIELNEDHDTSGGYSTGTQKVGLRFTGITIPQGAIITTAYLTFRAVAADPPMTNTQTTNVTIRGHLTANSTTFTSTNSNISNRTLSSAIVTWSSIPSWTTGVDYNSPSIVQIVQEIIDQGSWVSGNSLSIIITGTGHRSAASYDGSTSNSPKLTITYVVPTTYYSKGSLAVNTPSNWNTARDGSGTNATSFGTENIWVIQNSHAMTLSGSSSWDVGAFGTIEIESGGSWSNSSSGTVTVGTLQVDNDGSYIHGTSNSLPGSSKFFGATSTVDYSGTNQMVSALNYGNLTLSNAGTKTFAAGATGIAGVFTVSGTALCNFTANDATIDYNGTGAQTVKSLNYRHLIISGARTTNNVTLQPVFTIGVSGTFTITATFTSGGFIINNSSINYNGTGAQTVIAFNYNNLVVSGTRTANNVTFAPSGTIGIQGSFIASATFTSGGYVTTGSTIDYNGSSQPVTALGYNNLKLSNTGTKTFASGTTSISGNFSVTLPPPPYAPIGNYSKNYNPNYQTASVLGDITINTTANSSNIDYNGSGNQTVLAIDYYDLTLSNSGTKIFAAGTVGIGGNLSINDLAQVDAVTDNDTVKYFGTNKTVRYGFVNKNLKIDDNTSVTAGANIPVNNSLVISSGATLDMAGYVLTADSVIINDGTLISTNPVGIMSFYSKNTGNYNLLASWANSGYAGTNTPRLPGSVNNDVLIIGNGKTITLTSNVSNLGAIRVESTGTLSTDSYFLSGKGKFDLRSGGTLKIGSADGISSSGSIGNIQTATRYFSPGANYEYNGTAAQSTGNGLPSEVNNLVVNQPNSLTLSNDIEVNGTLVLASGLVILGSHNLTLSSAATINGTPSSAKMVVATGSGQLRKEFLGIGSFTFPVGDNDGTAEYSPVTLDFTSGTFASAYAGVKLVNAKHPQNTSTSNYLNRYWTVASSGITSFSCNVTFTYVDADVQPGGTESSIYGAQYEGSWNLLNPVNSSLNQISHTVSSFSDFTGGESSALPVELVSFNASVKQNSVYLSWKTETEVNNYGFEVERSADTENWIKIGFVNGYGNSNSLKEYSFEDSKLSNTSYYYRLKQVDNDGSFSYSNVVNVTVDYSPNSFTLSQNYPNPFNPSTKIRYSIPSVISSEARNLVTLKVYDILGTEVATLVNEAQSAGFYEVEFSGSQLTSGVYIYKIQIYPANGGAEGFSETRKMILTK